MSVYTPSFLCAQPQAGSTEYNVDENEHEWSCGSKALSEKVSTCDSYVQKVELITGNHSDKTQKSSRAPGSTVVSARWAQFVEPEGEESEESCDENELEISAPQASWHHDSLQDHNVPILTADQTKNLQFSTTDTDEAQFDLMPDFDI